MAELKNRPGSNITEIKSKTVTFLLDSQYHIITGSWYWDMESDTAFISDVIISLPTDFEGTKAIFHPDDVEEVKARMKGEEVAFLDFRIITTYGEVKTVTGEHLSIEPVEPIDQLTDDILQSVLKELEFKEEYSKIKLKNEIYGKCESFSQTGIWYHNTSTYKTWYSPYVYKLHELAPFSINAHLHSFHQFIHPDDKDIVIEYLDKAFTEKHPIHLDYKIQTLKGDKHVAYKSHWFYSQKGEWIVCGTMQDISQQQEFETAAEELKDLSYFQRQQLLFDEQNANLGHWQVNLLTRNAVYSDNYFRIFGLKPGAVPSTINAFINFIHPDDHEQVTGAQKRMLYEHAVPELEFRILRNDGKIRYISQKGKVIMLQGEMTVSGIIQDITVQRLLEKKVAEQNEELTEKKMEQLQAYEKGSIASWSMNVETGTISWSENFALFLGYKTNTLNMSQKTLFSFIHPQDHKIFKEHWSQVLRQKEDISFPFRVLQRGTVRYMEAHFTIKKVKETEFFIGIVKDNTTEYHLQDQLSQRVELAERLTDNILDCVIITDVNNTILLWSTSCEKAYGLKREDVIGENFFELFPRMKTEELKLFQRVLSGEKVVVAGKQALTGTGTYDVTLIPIWNGNEVTGIMQLMRDVTKEAQLQKTISERLHLIESLLQTSIDRIIALDQNMNYLYWNKKAEDYYGVKKENIIGKNVLEVFPEIRNDPAYSEFRRTLRGETVFIAADLDTERFFDTYLIPMKGDAGEITGVLWMARDLSSDLELLSKKQEQLESALAEDQLKKAMALLEQQVAVRTAELEERKSFIEHIAAATPDIIYLMDLHTKTITYSNKPLLEFLGYDEVQAEKIVDPFFELMHDDDIQRMLDHLEEMKTATDVEVREIEYRLKNADGKWIWFKDRNAVFNRDENKVPLAKIGITQNIAEKKYHEEEKIKYLSIQEQSEQLACMGSWEYVIETGAFNWSEGMYHLFGLVPRINVFPEIYIDVATEEDRAVAKRIVKHIKIEHTSFEEVIRIKKDSTVRQLKVKGDVIYNHKKEPYKLVGIDLDITDINEVKAKLETSKRWLQQTAEASPDAITIYNLSKKFPIYLNDRLAEWLQTTSEELLNIGIEGRLKLIHPDDRLTILHFNEKVAASADGQILTLDYRLKPSDDKILWIRNRAKVFERDAEGKVTQILSILQDITEEKKSEVKLQDLNQSLRKKNKDLEIKNEEITSFAFVGSHDLKEPIRKLHLFSDWLLEKEKKNISAQGINYLQGMIESVNRLDMLIEDLLILTKMNSSSDELTDVDLNKVAASSLKEMKDEIEKVNARITIPDLPVIKGNENQLLYLFKNMISNAIKFQVPGNQPIVKIEAKEVNGREIQNASVGLNKNYLSISFCDNGIGFNKVHEKKIFEIFRRLHSKEVYPGSGIGLTICKKVMERQGGFITVDSKVGIGSQFHCYFPLYS